eukprot:jgi/Astpho2/6918/fgenesh1_pg.00107_%23_8_t
MAFNLATELPQSLLHGWSDEQEAAMCKRGSYTPPISQDEGMCAYGIPQQADPEKYVWRHGTLNPDPDRKHSGWAVEGTADEQHVTFPAGGTDDQLSLCPHGTAAEEQCAPCPDGAAGGNPSRCWEADSAGKQHASCPDGAAGPRVAPPASAQTVAQLASSMLPVPVLPRHLTADPALQSTAATALESSLPNLDSSIVEVDHRAAGRAGGDARVQLLSPLRRPPVGFTGQQAHRLPSLAGIKFFKQAHVVDPDDPTQTFRFDLADRTHCASFNLGPSPSASPGTEDFLISWSNLYALYQLPDGSTWAEHGSLLDVEDLAFHAAQRSLSHDHLLQPCAMHMELFRKAGR